MINRLFTFGCSYTRYKWPTWADLLGLEFPLFFNWGHAGLGNRAITERLAEAHARSNFSENDIVVIQWSNPSRHDWLHFNKDNEDLSNWRTHGGIFSEENSEIFTHDWIERFWDEKAYFIHTFNSMIMAQQLLESTGCKWYMTSMYDITYSPSTYNTIWELDPSLEFYREEIFEKYKDKWLDPIEWVQRDTKNFSWAFSYDEKEIKTLMLGENNRNGDKWIEPHPSIKQHSIWMLILKEKIGLTAELTSQQTSLINEINQLQKESTGYRDFKDKIKKTNWYLTVESRGW